MSQDNTVEISTIYVLLYRIVEVSTRAFSLKRGGSSFVVE